MSSNSPSINNDQSQGIDVASSITMLGAAVLKITDKLAEMEKAKAETEAEMSMEKRLELQRESDNAAFEMAKEAALADQQQRFEERQQESEERTRAMIEGLYETMQELSNRVLMRKTTPPRESPQDPSLGERRSSIQAVNVSSRLNPMPETVDPAATIGGKQSVKPIVLHQYQPVPLRMITKTISIQSLVRALKNQDQYMSEYDTVRSLPHFMDREEVIKQVYLNQKRLGTSIGEVLELKGMLNLSDQSFIRMYTQYIRTMYAYTREACIDIIRGIVHPVHALNSRYVWGPRNYDGSLFVPVHSMLTDQEQGYHLLTDNATAAEMEFFPEVAWGNNKKPGLFMILMSAFGEFKPGFEAYATIEKLKQLQTWKEYFAMFHSINCRLADASIVAKQSEAKMTHVRTMQEIESTPLKASSSQAPEPTYTRLLQRDDNADRARKVIGSSRELQPQQRTPFQAGSRLFRREDGIVPKQAYPRLFSHSQGPARQSSIADDSYEGDEPSTYDSSPERQYPDARQIAPQPLELQRPDMAYEEDEDLESAVDLSAIMRPSNTFNRAKAEDGDRQTQKPCFAFFKTKECPGNCGYSHKLEDMQKVRDQRVAEVLNSPWSPAEWQEGLAKQILSSRSGQHAGSPATPQLRQRPQYNPRNASLSSVIESPAAVVNGASSSTSVPNQAEYSLFSQDNASSAVDSLYSPASFQG